MPLKSVPYTYAHAAPSNCSERYLAGLDLNALTRTLLLCSRSLRITVCSALQQKQRRIFFTAW